MLESILLGLIQGLTEFLPVSSSGHLVLIREFLGLPLQNTLGFDILLNTATLIAVIGCFWGDLKRIVIDFKTEGLSTRSKKLLLSLLIATIPAAIIGYVYGDQIEASFRSAQWVAWGLIVGSVLMFLADKVSGSRGSLTGQIPVFDPLRPLRSLAIGFFQALAFIPGISRAGATISGGLLTGLSREEAIRFSFLLYIPISLGAALKAFLDFNSSIIPYPLFTIHSAFAFLTALISGTWAIKFMLRYLSKNSFTPFIIYRLLLALAILLFL